QKNKNLVEISLDALFDHDVQYIIPTYQRNYAWDDLEREQLMEDVVEMVDVEEDYFLGSLVVYEKEESVYEVIDCQQRLTTLFILFAALEKLPPAQSLRFEARDKSNHTLDKLAEGALGNIDERFYSMELIRAWQQFKQNQPDLKRLMKKLSDIKLLRIIVPHDTDLNHYFEIMNTRGEQLEAHEILKARFMSQISGEDIHFKRSIFAKIRDACANMERYVQMSFPTRERKQLFGQDYDQLRVQNFVDLMDKFQTKEMDQPLRSDMSVLDAIDSYKQMTFEEEKSSETDEEDERFESIISFPNFLLHVLKLYNKTTDKDEEHALNDNKLLDNFATETEPEKFIYMLLKARFLFDQYIIKREYYYHYKEEGVWSLQKLKKYDGSSVDYVNTYGKAMDEDVHRKIRTIQSALRTTYTSPRTMHWITQSLDYIYKHDGEHQSDGFLYMLESYASKKVQENMQGKLIYPKVSRIVFTFLDYVLWRDGYKDIIKPLEPRTFSFRSSVEHFYPQNADTAEGHKR